jgi:hypothetical protein
LSLTRLLISFLNFRRTGKVIDIKARLDKFGFERVSDYFPDTGL